MATVDIILRGDTADASRKLNAFFGQLNQDLDGLVGNVRNQLAGGLLSIFSTALLKRGVEFNQLMEDSRVSIAGVLRNFDRDRFDDFNDALKESDAILESLNDHANRSSASLSGLVEGFQATASSAIAANIPLDDYLELLVLISQTLPIIGIRQEQLTQETRALLTGNITEDAAAARNLGITRAMIQAAIERGELAAFLTEKMLGFAEAGDVAMGNLTTKISNLGDSIDRSLGKITLPLMESLTDAIDALSGAVTDPGLQQGLSLIVDDLRFVIDHTVELGNKGSQHLGKVVSVLRTLGHTAGAAFTIWAAKSAIAFAVTPVGAFAAAIAGAVSILETGVEVWRLWNAKKKEALSTEGLQEQTVLMIQQLQKHVDLLEKSGKLTKERAETMRQELGLLYDQTDFLGPEMSNDIARAYAKEIRKAAEITKEAVEKEAPKLEVISESLAKARAKAELAVALHRIEMEEAVNEAAYQKGERTFEQYLERREALINKAAAEQSRFQFDALRTGDAEARQEATLQMTLVQINAQKELLQIEVDRHQMQERNARETEATERQAEQLRLASIRNLQRLANEQHNLELQRIQALRDAGEISNREAQDRINQAGRTLQASLRGVLDSLEEFKDIEGIGAEMLALESTIERIQGSLRDPGFLGNMLQQLRQLKNEWQDLGVNASNVLIQGVQLAVQGVSDAIYGAITGTKTWGAVFAQVGQSMIRMMISMVVQWIASKTIIAALEAIFHATSIGMAATTAAAWAPAAVAASIATGGGAAVTGTAAYISSLAVGKAASVVAAFEKGGLVKGGRQLIQVNEAGEEYVVPAHVVRGLGVDLMDKLRQGDFSKFTAGMQARLSPSAIHVARPNTEALGAIGEDGRSNLAKVDLMQVMANMIEQNQKEQAIFRRDMMQMLEHQRRVEVNAPPAEVIIVHSEKEALKVLESRPGRAIVKKIMAGSLFEMGVKE